MIIYDVLQHYSDNRRSPESSLLTSPLAKNNGGVKTQILVLKDTKLTESLLVSSHVPILKHEA